MASEVLYVAEGASEGAVRSAVQSHLVNTGLDFDVEPAGEYPRFATAVVLFGRTETIEHEMPYLTKQLTSEVGFTTTSDELERMRAEHLL